MTPAERKARQNPICQRFRKMSVELSYKLRHRLADGFEYNRSHTHNYTITLRKGKLVYFIWYMSNRNCSVCVDRRTRPARGITTDPDLKCLATIDFGPNAADQVCQILEKHGVVNPGSAAATVR